MEIAKNSFKEKKQKINKINITFVCTGNTCRSPMAEFIFKDFLIKKGLQNFYAVRSAGICADTSQFIATNARLVLSEMGIKTPNRKAKTLTRDLAEKSDLLICMTTSHALSLQEFKNKVFSIAQITGGQQLNDPYGQSIEVYRKVAQYLIYACEDIIKYAGAIKN